MQKLLNMETGMNQGILNAPWWSYVKDGLKNNLDQVISYYRRFPTAVNSSHFLAKLITTLGTHRDDDYLRFLTTIKGRSLSVAMSHQMTSSLSKGITFDGIFYGKGSTEIIIGTNEDFDIFEARDNWRNLEPVKILRHPKSDLSLLPINGEAYNGEEGISVISINLTMLAIQYREFRLLEDKIAEEYGESPRSMEQFIHAYPLTNALRSHLDQCLFNRMYNLLINKPMGYCNKTHPFYLTDYSSKLDLIYSDLLKRINSPMKFDTILRQIPLVSNDSLKELSVLPECAPTRQVVWGLVCSRLQILDFLVRTNSNVRIQNGRDLNNIRRSFNLFQTDKALKASLPIEDYFDEKIKIDKILKA